MEWYLVKNANTKSFKKKPKTKNVILLGFDEKNLSFFFKKTPKNCILEIKLRLLLGRCIGPRPWLMPSLTAMQFDYVLSTIKRGRTAMWVETLPFHLQPQNPQDLHRLQRSCLPKCHTKKEKKDFPK